MSAQHLILPQETWHNLLNKPKLVPTCINLGARRGRGVHGRLPVKIGALPGPASKCLEAVERWGALEARAALGTVGIPVGAHGGDALTHDKTCI